MSLFALLAVLLLEHFFPATPQRVLALKLPLHLMAEQLNAGQHAHGKLAWFAAVVPAVLVTGVLYNAAYHVSAWLGWFVDIGVLYYGLQFRQSTLAANAIYVALLRNEPGLARARFQQWQHHSPPTDKSIVDVTIQQLFSDALYELFGVIFWFVLLAHWGPIGVVLYRLSHAVVTHWQPESHGTAFTQFGLNMTHWLDWLPARGLALSFAIGGHFEDAMYHWRNQPKHAVNTNLHIVLATGAGALGIRTDLMNDEHNANMAYNTEVEQAETASAQDIANAISLIWRALAVWLLVILLVELGHFQT